MTKNTVHISPALQEFNRIFKEFNMIYRDAALKLGLSNSVFDIFYTICESGDCCTQKYICDATFLPKQIVHSAIQKLDAEGLVELKPGKGRSVNICLTPLGEEELHTLINPVFELENAVFESMSANDTEKMLELNNRYLSILREQFSKL